MLHINFYLKSVKHNNPRPINMSFRYNKRKLIYATGEMIAPKHFETERGKRFFQRANTGYIGFNELNAHLDHLESTAATIFRQFVNDHHRIPETHELKKLLDLKLRFAQEKEKPSMLRFIQNLINESEKNKINKTTGSNICKGTVRIYRNTLQRLKEFEIYSKIKVEYENVDQIFYEKWVEFLSKELNLSWNTTGRFVKTLKFFMAESVEAGLTNNLAFKSKKFKVLTETVKKIYLTENELNEIYDLDLSKSSKLDNVRDMFIISCRSGLRYSDLSSLTSENIQGNFFNIKSKKTGQEIVLPLHWQVKEILKKHKDCANSLPRSISNVKFNLYLKQLSRLVPSLNVRVLVSITRGGKLTTESKAKWELVTTHSGRRSFCTGLYLEGISSLTIMALSGHRTESQFLKYLKATPLQNANLLQKHWDQKEQTKNLQLH